MDRAGTEGVCKRGPMEVAAMKRRRRRHAVDGLDL